MIINREDSLTCLNLFFESNSNVARKSNRRVDSPGLRFAGPPSLRLRRKVGKEKERKPLYARSGERGDERSDVGGESILV